METFKFNEDWYCFACAGNKIRRKWHDNFAKAAITISIKDSINYKQLHGDFGGVYETCDKYVFRCSSGHLFELVGDKFIAL